ncbi:MAG: LLM class oxidoreductase [Bacteroidota bacterium]
MISPIEDIAKGYNQTFQANKLSLGLVVPIESYPDSRIPSMQDHLNRVKLAEDLGFSAIWVRDVPFDVPQFGDVGQTFDPFTYLGYLAASTHKITLGVSSIALPLHQPVHVAKSSATLDHMSEGRFVLGVASGDRPLEYPATGLQYAHRGEMFQEAFEYIRRSQDHFPTFETTHFGSAQGIDILPKPISKRIPMLITGFSQQSMEWNAEHGDGWMYYPQNVRSQEKMIDEWRKLSSKFSNYTKPFMQPLYVDLTENDDTPPTPIHLGIRTGSHHLLEYFQVLQEIGVNHVAINLRFNQLPIQRTIEHLATKVLDKIHSS